MTWTPTERLSDHARLLLQPRLLGRPRRLVAGHLRSYTVNEGVFTNVQTFNSSLDPRRRFIYDLPNKYYPGGTFGPY